MSELFLKSVAMFSIIRLNVDAFFSEVFYVTELRILGPFLEYQPCEVGIQSGENSKSFGASIMSLRRG